MTVRWVCIWTNVRMCYATIYSPKFTKFTKRPSILSYGIFRDLNFIHQKQLLLFVPRTTHTHMLLVKMIFFVPFNNIRVNGISTYEPCRDVGHRFWKFQNLSHTDFHSMCVFPSFISFHFFFSGIFPYFAQQFLKEVHNILSPN